MSSVMHRLEYFASAFASEPSQVLEIPDGAILGEWLAENVPGFDPALDCVTYSIPLTEPVHGRVIAEMVPKGGVIQSILKPVFKLLGLAPNTPKAPSNQQQDDIEIAAFQGNQVKYGQVVREAFGRNRIFPDYLVPRRRYFQDRYDHWVEMLLCVGVGAYDISASSATFGRTPVVSLEGGYVKVYQPGESLVGERIADWWYTVPEVGATTIGGGIRLNSIFPATRDAPLGTYLFSGKAITPIGGHLFPDDWATGMYLDIRYTRSYAINGSTLTGNFDGLQVSAGDTVEVDGDFYGEFAVVSYTPATGGTSGSPSIWSATTGPSLDYSGTPALFTVTAGTLTATFSVDGTFGSESDLLAELNAAALQTALASVVRFRQGMEIEELEPYAGRRITVTNTSGAEAMFGDLAAANASTLVGTPAAAGTGAQLTLDGFVADTPSAQLFIRKTGERFVITGVSTSIVTVDRVDEDGESNWLGWGAGFEAMDTTIALGEDSSEGGWAGPYRATPADELCTAIEFDVMFPSGMGRSRKDGDITSVSTTVEFRYRGAPDEPWESEMRTYSDNQRKMFGVTERIEFSTPRRITEAAMRRTNPDRADNRVVNTAEWYGLRTQIVGAPTSYPEFTCVAVRVKGSSAVGIEADEMLSVVATRILDGIPERRISKAVEYIAKRVPINHGELNALESIWTARGDRFDFSFEKAATIKQATKTALAVGFADFSIDDGVLTPVRDQLIPPEMLYAYRQTFSAQNTTQPIVTNVELISDDETDCLDVEYLDETTWRVETVRCKEPPTIVPNKIEKLKADGIINRDRAYRFGMRELMRRKTEREQIKTQTELSGLNAGFGKYVNFINEIPGWSQSSVVKSMQGLVLESADTLDWQDSGEHVVALRRDDGTMSAVLVAQRIDDHRILLTEGFGFTPRPYHTHLFFGSRDRMSTPAIMREVRPSGYRVNLMAIAYNPEKYIYDDAEADN